MTQLWLARQDLQQQDDDMKYLNMCVWQRSSIPSKTKPLTEGWNRVCNRNKGMHAWMESSIMSILMALTMHRKAHTFAWKAYTPRHFLFFLKKKTQPYCRCQGPATCFLLISSAAGPGLQCQHTYVLYCAVCCTIQPCQLTVINFLALRTCIQAAVAVSQKWNVEDVLYISFLYESYC